MGFLVPSRVPLDILMTGLVDYTERFIYYMNGQQETRKSGVCGKVEKPSAF